MLSTRTGRGAAGVAPPRARSAAVAPALAGTLALATVAWVISLRQMSGMDMGVATMLGSLASFATLWTVMMAAMMLPGAVPAVAQRANHSPARSVPVFVAAYLAVWVLAGLIVYALYEPHGTVAAGVVTIAAGLYELTPLKRYFRQRCYASSGSGVSYGLCCVGSSAGLMAMLVVLGVMSVTPMVVIAALVAAQKFLPATAVIDVPLALAITGLGIAILVAPAAMPWLTPAM